jgi:hypothetical protein
MHTRILIDEETVFSKHFDQSLGSPRSVNQGKGTSNEIGILRIEHTENAITEKGPDMRRPERSCTVIEKIN